jgi:hypothetical protein
MSYSRVLPRDLFNEADLLKCLGRLWIKLSETQGHDAKIAEEQVDGFVVVQSEDDGSISVENLTFTVGAEQFRLWRPLNSRDAWPLWATKESNEDFEEVRVFDEDGELSQEMLSLVTAPGPLEDETVKAGLRAIRALRIVEKTNQSDLGEEGDAFAAVHEMANDLTIETQRALARRLGWILQDGEIAKDVPDKARSMLDELLHGVASIDQIADAIQLPADSPERAS